MTGLSKTHLSSSALAAPPLAFLNPSSLVPLCVPGPGTHHNEPSLRLTAAAVLSCTQTVSAGAGYRDRSSGGGNRICRCSVPTTGTMHRFF